MLISTGQLIAQGSKVFFVYGQVSFSPASAILGVLAVLGLIAINAFFVTAEFSIVSVRQSRIQQLVQTGDANAKTVQSLQRNLDRLLSTTQIGITLSSLALGWIGERTMAVLLAATIMQWSLPSGVQDFLVHSVSVPLAFGLLVYLQIVLGELCPKAVALLYDEQLARLLSPPSLAIARLFNPFIWVLNQSTRLLLRLGGVKYAEQTWSKRVTPEELQFLIATTTSTGLEAEERQLLNNIFEFGEVTAEEVMVPRTSIVAIASTATFQALLEEVASSGFSRYPVTGESLDDIRGILNFKELAEPLAKGILKPETSIQAWVRPARFVPEYTPIHELLSSMQRSRQTIVVVVDEFGGTAGLVTISDIVAEIIGDGADADDLEAPSIQILDEQTFRVQAQLDLEEVNERLGLNLPITDEYQTLGGFLIYEMQKVPAPGETLCYATLELRVISADGPRLDQIEIRQLETSLGSGPEPDRSPNAQSHFDEISTVVDSSSA